MIVWAQGGKGVAYVAASAVLGDRDVALRLLPAARLRVTVARPEPSEGRPLLSFVEYRLNGGGRSQHLGLGSASGDGRKYFNDRIPSSAAEIRVGGAWVVPSDWISVTLSAGETYETVVDLDSATVARCSFQHPFSGIVDVFVRDDGRWLRAWTQVAPGPSTTLRLSRSIRVGAAALIVAYGVEGEETSSGVVDIGESEVIAIERRGAGRIVVTSTSGPRAVTLSRALAGSDQWEPVRRVSGLGPSTWKLEPAVRLIDEEGGRAVFGGLLPGRYRVDLKALDESGVLVELEANESKTVNLDE